jgi:Tfp pilus assembly pilus retraction ATPase PilT
MISLQGVLTASELEIVRTSVELRFDPAVKLKTPEALIIYEQRLLDEETLLKLCSKEYGFELETPTVNYLPQEIIQHFGAFNCIPLRMDSVKEEIHIAIVPELHYDLRVAPYRNYTTVLHRVPLYYYVKHYTNLYSSPGFLLRIPPKDLFDFIIEEAVGLKASDITISNTARSAAVYYNVRKKKVYAKRVISRGEVIEIVELICAQAGSPLIEGSRKPKYVGIRLDTHNRGRVVINSTQHGWAITVRVLPDEMLTTRPKDLKHDAKTIKFLEQEFMNDVPGMRVLIGPTMSGKNTTVLSALLDTLEADEHKIVSVEAPVEIVVPNMEQISAETGEEFMENVMSLLRQNPDKIYISEMTNMTAKGTMEIANTGKVLFTSIHANSIAEVYSRIQDLTELSFDRITLTLHSAVYQELKRRDDGELYPETRCLYFSDELKAQLLGKTLGEIYTTIREEEAKWCLIDSDT